MTGRSWFLAVTVAIPLGCSPMIQYQRPRGGLIQPSRENQVLPARLTDGKERQAGGRLIPALVANQCPLGTLMEALSRAAKVRVSVRNNLIDRPLTMDFEGGTEGEFLALLVAVSNLERIKVGGTWLIVGEEQLDVLVYPVVSDPQLLAEMLSDSVSASGKVTASEGLVVVVDKPSSLERVRLILAELERKGRESFSVLMERVEIDNRTLASLQVKGLLSNAIVGEPLTALAVTALKDADLTVHRGLKARGVACVVGEGESVKFGVTDQLVILRQNTNSVGGSSPAGANTVNAGSTVEVSATRVEGGVRVRWRVQEKQITPGDQPRITGEEFSGTAVLGLGDAVIAFVIESGGGTNVVGMTPSIKKNYGNVCYLLRVDGLRRAIVPEVGRAGADVVGAASPRRE